MTLKPSHRDLILLIGILVAMVVAITTWVYTDGATNLTGPGKTGKSRASLVINQLFKRTPPACTVRAKS